MYTVFLMMIRELLANDFADMHVQLLALFGDLVNTLLLLIKPSELYKHAGTNFQQLFISC